MTAKYQNYFIGTTILYPVIQAILFNHRVYLVLVNNILGRQLFFCRVSRVGRKYTQIDRTPGYYMAKCCVGRESRMNNFVHFPAYSKSNESNFPRKVLLLCRVTFARSFFLLQQGSGSHHSGVLCVGTATTYILVLQKEKSQNSQCSTHLNQRWWY